MGMKRSRYDLWFRAIVSPSGILSDPAGQLNDGYRRGTQAYTQRRPGIVDMSLFVNQATNSSSMQVSDGRDETGSLGNLLLLGSDHR